MAQKEAAFPAMTVCPGAGGYKLDVLQDNGINSISSYNNMKGACTWSSNDSSISEVELFEKATYDLNELVKRFYIRFFFANPVSFLWYLSTRLIEYLIELVLYFQAYGLSTNTKLNLTMDVKLNPSITEQRHRAFGRCYTIYPAEDIRRIGVYYYKVDL